MDKKKVNDVISSLEAQKKMGIERLDDPLYLEIWDQIQRDLDKIEIQLNKLKKR